MGFNFLLTWEKDTCENASRTIWRLDYNQIWPCSESWALKRVLLRSSIFHVSIKIFLPYTGESKSTFLFLQKKKKKSTFLWESKHGWMIYSFVQSSNTSKKPIICVICTIIQLNHKSQSQAHFCSWIWGGPGHLSVGMDTHCNSYPYQSRGDFQDEPIPSLFLSLYEDKTYKVKKRNKQTNLVYQ